MLFHNKKAISIEFLTAVFLVLVGFFVLAGVITIFTERLPSEEADQICKISVNRRAASMITVGEGAVSAPLSPLLCKTQEFTINAKRKTNKEILTVLLNDVAKIKNVWGDGHYGGGLYGNFLFFGSDSCYKYRFVKIKNLQGSIESHQVIDFMKNEVYQKKNITYWKYIAENTEYSGFNILDPIQDQHIYAIIFADVRYKRPYTTGQEHYNEIYIADLNRKEIEVGAWGLGPVTLGTKTCTFLSGTGGA